MMNSNYTQEVPSLVLPDLKEAYTQFLQLYASRDLEALKLITSESFYDLHKKYF